MGAEWMEESLETWFYQNKDIEPYARLGVRCVNSSEYAALKVRKKLSKSFRLCLGVTCPSAKWMRGRRWMRRMGKLFQGENQSMELRMWRTWTIWKSAAENLKLMRMVFRWSLKRKEGERNEKTSVKINF